MRSIVVLGLGLVVSVIGCSDPADFRPAKGAESLPSVKEAYRITKEEDVEACRSIGFVKRARRIEDIATTVANNGGTHYRVLNDQQSASMRTNFTVTKTFDGAEGTASTYAVKHHLYTAEAYRCGN